MPSHPPPPLSGEATTSEAEAAAQSTHHALLAKGSKAVDRVKTGTVGTLWSRLNAVDFMKSAMEFAALAMLCMFPFLVVVSAALGGDARRTIITRLGLNAHAAKDVDSLMSSGQQAVSGLSILGIAFLLLGAIGIAATMQGWYQRVYDQEPEHNWKKELLNRLLWLASLVAYVWVEVLIGRQVGPLGGHVVIYLAEFVVAVVFWWWSVHVLLLGKVGWRELFPVGVATGICLTGLSVVSSFAFSSSIISNEKSYGPIGVVMTLLSYVIGLAVVLHIGAVAGRMWSERHTPVSEMT